MYAPNRHAFKVTEIETIQNLNVAGLARIGVGVGILDVESWGWYWGFKDLRLQLDFRLWRVRVQIEFGVEEGWDYGGEYLGLE